MLANYSVVEAVRKVGAAPAFTQSGKYTNLLKTNKQTKNKSAVVTKRDADLD